MDLIQNSKDLLYIVIAFCILWLTIFLAWFVYYLVMIMRQVFLIIKETRDKLEKLNKTIREFKKKMEHGTAYLKLINEGIDKVSEAVKKRNKKKK